MDDQGSQNHGPGAGTGHDVRVLVARVHRELTTEAGLSAELPPVPWDRFLHGQGFDTVSRVPWLAHLDDGVYPYLAQTPGEHARRVLGENTQDLAEPDLWV